MADGQLWRIGKGDAASKQRSLLRGIEWYAQMHADRAPTHCLVHPENEGDLVPVDGIIFEVGRGTLADHVYFTERVE